VTPLLPELDKDSTAAQTAITVPLQEQVSMTSEIATPIGLADYFTMCQTAFTVMPTFQGF
jgi:hypothetical protein